MSTEKMGWKDVLEVKGRPFKNGMASHPEHILLNESKYDKPMIKMASIEFYLSKLFTIGLVTHLNRLNILGLYERFSKYG